MSALDDKVYRALKPHLSALRAGGLIIGVSGGADSLALLHLLWRLSVERRAMGGLRLHAATLDHGLRGDAGAADAAFVVETARAWGLPVTAGAARLDPDLPGVEARARAARYTFLAETARAVGASHVAAAHHADDQAETVLLRLLRGAGARGLGGMRPVAPLPGAPDLTLLRPLLDTTRAEITAYCADHGLSPRHDASNADPTHLRNRLRLDVLPMLRQINPQIARALNRLAQAAAEDDAYLDLALMTALDGALTRDSGRIILARGRYAGLHPALRRRFVWWAAGELGAEPDFDGVLAAVLAADTGPTGRIAVLGEGVRLRVTREAVVVEGSEGEAPRSDNP